MTLARLYAIQANWNHERMIGVGMAWAAQPILAELLQRDRGRHSEAVARSAEFFNSNPNVAGLAVGALATAELEGVPGAQVQRLRTALAGPLGALGDRFFWAGMVPLLSGVALALVATGAGLRAVALLLVGYNVVRALVTAWSLRTGLREGMQVGAAVGRSWLPRAAERIGGPAAFAVGVALPLAADWLVGEHGPALAGAALTVVAGGLLLQRLAGGRVTALRLTVVLLVLVLLAARFLT